MAIQKPLVLVADNERTSRNILCRILELGGYRTITAPEGEMALRLAEERKPDVMLLEMVMPRINGREVCRRVHKISAETRIVYYSTIVDPTDAAQLRELRHEADAVIAKPASRARILSKINNVLQGCR